MLALADDIRRVTFPLPNRPGHVHAYLLGEDDGWTLVDTGLALPDLEERLREVVNGLDRPITRVAVTHFHPDHVGGTGVAREIAGAEVFQGVLDYEQCVHVWGNREWPTRIAAWFVRHGVPKPVANELIEMGARFDPFIRFARDPQRLEEGDRLGSWKVVELPGHADGHLGFVRDGALVTGDHLLAGISPAIGLWPDSRPDPLGDYLRSLERTIALDLRIAYPGHGEPLDDPAGRARELVEHHVRRLDEAETALASVRTARTGYQVSLDLFGGDLTGSARRFAVAGTLSHLERLVVEGRAARTGDGGTVSYTAS